jgi:hypothetical protein
MKKISDYTFDGSWASCRRGAMKRLILLIAFVPPPAMAQVFECPKFYPNQDTVLSEVPYRHDGKGVIARGEITGGRWMGGEFNDTFGVMQGPAPKNVPGETISVVPTFARWLVCDYTSGVQWWEELKLAELKQCSLHVRDRTKRDPMDVKLVCH